MLRSLDRRLTGLARSLSGATRSFAVKPIKGRATTSGTMKFMRQSQLPLYHQFHKSQLFINPIIHGAPKKLYALDDKDRVYIEALTRRAVLVNRSNCVVIYKHHEEGEPWYSTNLSALFNDVSREQIVTVAHLGLATSKEEVFRRLAKACEITGLQTIDMALVEINETTKAALVEGSIIALDELCTNGQLQSFGFQVSVAPYVFHTPALKQTGPQMMMPMNLESGLAEAQFADLVAYPISPTTHIPATYPMLDADPPGQEEGDEGAGSDDESKRTFTRAAVNPLTCRFGGNAVFQYESPEVMKARGIRRRTPGDEEARQREMARRRERRARQAEEGVQSQLEQEVLLRTLDRLRKCKVFSREDCERVIYELAGAEAAGASRADLAEYRSELAQLADLAERGELGNKEGVQQEGGDGDDGSDGDSDSDGVEAVVRQQDGSVVAEEEEGKKANTSGSAALDYISEDEFSDAEDAELAEEVSLLSGLRDRESEEHMAASLDRMCPALASTPRLQDKALRVVFSVGVDVAIVDAEQSAMMGKLALRPGDMLSHRDTEGVFGKFCVAYDKEQADGDGHGAGDGGGQGDGGDSTGSGDGPEEGAPANPNADRARRLLERRRLGTRTSR